MCNLYDKISNNQSLKICFRYHLARALQLKTRLIHEQLCLQLLFLMPLSSNHELIIQLSRGNKLFSCGNGFIYVNSQENKRPFFRDNKVIYHKQTTYLSQDNYG